MSEKVSASNSFWEEFVKESESLDWTNMGEGTVMDPPAQFQRQDAINNLSQMPGKNIKMCM